ncbi:hypothetical protein [Aggregatilinea lenta]|uniref:hypothetical protein n=1 Tax=Aggregatilinea lenta TaxID=913108 RepID=UPI000E5A8D5B|nr:hypothetical protein [Aggregatilinea lenta]
MDRWQSFFFSILASIFVWVAVFAAKLVGANDGMLSFAIFAAFGGNLAIWLVWVFTVYGDKPNEGVSAEKAKRTAPTQAAPDDARVALLLQLMDDEDRRELKRRLMDDLTADGESVALADLLAAQDERLRRSGR